MTQGKAMTILSKAAHGLTLRDAMDLLWEEHRNNGPLPGKVQEAFDLMATKLGEPLLDED